jgi:hypothetical protein
MHDSLKNHRNRCLYLNTNKYRGQRDVRLINNATCMQDILIPEQTYEQHPLHPSTPIPEKTAFHFRLQN